MIILQLLFFAIVLDFVFSSVMLSNVRNEFSEYIVIVGEIIAQTMKIRPDNKTTALINQNYP